MAWHFVFLNIECDVPEALANLTVVGLGLVCEFLCPWIAPQSCCSVVILCDVLHKKHIPLGIELPLDSPLEG